MIRTCEEVKKVRTYWKVVLEKLRKGPDATYKERRPINRRQRERFVYQLFIIVYKCMHTWVHAFMDESVRAGMRECVHMWVDGGK